MSTIRTRALRVGGGGGGSLSQSLKLDKCQHSVYSREMPTITMDKKSIAFLDTNSTVNEDGKVEVSVYRKATHTSKYLDFHSQSPAQNKRAVVKTLLDPAKCIPSTTARRRSEERCVINDLKDNGYPENFIKSVDQTNNAQPKPRESPRLYVSIPYIKSVSERIRRILSRENIKTAFKPLKTLGHVFKKPKDRPTKEHLKGIVYKVSCRTCPFTYVGESKRSWKSRGLEHKPGTNRNIGSAVKQHAKTTGHDIHPNCASSSSNSSSLFKLG